MNKKNAFRINYKNITIATSLALTLGLTGCGTTEHPYEPQDPLQTINRGTFKFNQEFDKFVLKPLATGYKKITPAPVRDGVNNFYWNLAEIPTTINNLLQGHPKDAMDSLGRLAINSTAGILGIFDVAKHAGLERKENDFGITLAKYGFTSSPYFVIPFLGPSNFRDGIGLLVDYDPFSIFPYMNSVKARNILLGMDYVRIRANFLENEDVLDVAALDQYTLLRDAYIQRRAMQMEQHGVTWDQAKYYEFDDADLTADEYWAIDGTENMPESTVEPPLKAENDKKTSMKTDKKSVETTSSETSKTVANKQKSISLTTEAEKKSVAPTKTTVMSEPVDNTNKSEAFIPTL